MIEMVIMARLTTSAKEIMMLATTAKTCEEIEIGGIVQGMKFLLGLVMMMQNAGEIWTAATKVNTKARDPVAINVRQSA